LNALLKEMSAEDSEMFVNQAFVAKWKPALF
jgi:hypothetical protein